MVSRQRRFGGPGHGCADRENVVDRKRAATLGAEMATRSEQQLSEILSDTEYRDSNTHAAIEEIVADVVAKSSHGFRVRMFDARDFEVDEKPDVPHRLTDEASVRRHHAGGPPACRCGPASRSQSISAPGSTYHSAGETLDDR